MRICRRHISLNEALTFAVLYLVLNFVVLKLQHQKNKALRSEKENGNYDVMSKPYTDKSLYMHTEISFQVDERGDGPAEILAEIVPKPELSFHHVENQLENPPQSRENYRTILFWNKLFNSDDYRFGIGHQPFLDNGCGVHQCVTTRDRSQLDSADMVMFHGPKIEDFPPPRRPRGQVYAYVQLEPHETISAKEIPHYDGHMNLTITNRRDGDIWIPYAQITYDKLKARHRPSIIDLTEKKRSLAWMVSHCNTPGKREWYVRELQKHIDVDVYGDCGDLGCTKDDTWFCYEKLARDYYFYLSLENNHCKDYVSEKTYRPLEFNVVPVVFGGANYTELTPPHSVINILDYPHPQNLAKHLHFLIAHPDTYKKFFSWKWRGYQVETNRKIIMGSAFCRLCEILHEPSFNFRDYATLTSWWTTGMCDPTVIPRMKKASKW